MSRPPRVRFAPSPTGSLHLGNARTALFNWLVARGSGGAFVLRIEDTDTDREQRGSEAGILEDLRWLGLDWDEGPDVGGGHGPYRQSERGEHYRAAADRLLAAGKAYPCFCEGEGGDAAAGPGYPGTCRRLDAEARAARIAAGEAHALRFAVPPLAEVAFVDRLRGSLQVQAGELSDPVILRRDGRPTYNFAVVVDDAAMAIDLVIRGDDHLSNTYRQVLIFDALGLPRPQFAHLPMVRGADGSRLSKRHGAVSVGEFRRRGYPASAMLNALALLGWSPGGDRTLVEPEELRAAFDLDRVGKSAATFDAERLDWIAGQHLQREPTARLGKEIGARLEAAGLLPAEATASAGEWLAGVGEMLRGKLTRYDQVAERSAALFAAGGRPREAAAVEVLADDATPPVLRALASEFAAAAPEDEAAWKEVKKRVQQASGQKGKPLFHAIRVALTGSVAGPELDRLVPLITEGHRRFPRHVPSAADRVRRTLACLEG